MSRYLIFILTYFLGAIPFAYLAGLLKGIDVRRHGSGNIGTTNAFRLLGVTWRCPKGGLVRYAGLLGFGALGRNRWRITCNGQP